MKSKFDTLRQIPLFADWSRDELHAVAAVADEIDVPAGTTLTLEGEKAREFVVVVAGEATVEIQGEPVGTLRDGDFLGEIALLTRARRTATVRTTKQSRLFVLTDRAFRQLADTVPAFARRTWQSASERAGVEHAPAA